MKSARELFEDYINDGLSMNPPFKGFGFMLIKFAIDHPEEYKELFIQENHYDDFYEYLYKEVYGKKALKAIMQTFNLNQDEAMKLYKTIYCTGHGLATLAASGASFINDNMIAETIGETCRGFILSLRAGKDERTAIKPGDHIEMNGEVEDYISLEGLNIRNAIIGIGHDKAMHRVYLDEVLYFEAVGDLVFAYTDEQVYEIKKRLYQIEEELKNKSFIRISKSILANLDEITEIHPGDNRTMIALLSNKEQVVISRHYAKDTINAIKALWNE